MFYKITACNLQNLCNKTNSFQRANKTHAHLSKPNFTGSLVRLSECHIIFYIFKFENIINRRTTHQIETKVFTNGIQESNNQFVILLLFFCSSAFNSHHDVSLFVTLNLSSLRYYCSVWPWPPFPFIICPNYQQTKIYTICFLNLSFSFFIFFLGGGGVWYLILLY